MNALLKGKKEWERQQQEQFEIVADHLLLTVKKVSAKRLRNVDWQKWSFRILNFFLFLIYQTGSLILNLVAAVLQGGRPMIEKSPGHFVELSEEYSELHSKESMNPFLRK